MKYLMNSQKRLDAEPLRLGALTYFTLPGRGATKNWSNPGTKKSGDRAIRWPDGRRFFANSAHPQRASRL